MIAFLVGFFATWFFEFGIPTVLQCPGAKLLGNVDVSWLAGGLTAGILYAVLARRTAGRSVSRPVIGADTSKGD